MPISKPPSDRYTQYIVCARKIAISPYIYSSMYKDEPYPFGTQFSADGLGRTQYAGGRLKNKNILPFEHTHQI